MKKFNILTRTFLAACLALIHGGVHAQAPSKPTAGKIFQDLKRLNVLGNVLYLAAHPDDENTTLIAYMANHKLYNTGYLALTRGDGGQNLIGPEIREGLGVIRTQELLQARRTDGGRQFFTRANDFGFSKNPDEVFSIWNKETLLGDVVWVIRNFKPDVIITRFPKDSRAGHGQHSASSILAEEAFSAAADPKKFPEQLKFVSVWQPKRLVWNLSSWAYRNPKEFEQASSNLLKIDVGVYNPLLGKSYGEISAESRSMHKSQGFGSTGTRGNYYDYFQHTRGDSAKTDLFEDINTSWSRVKNSSKVQQAIAKAISSFNINDPASVVPALLSARAEMNKLTDDFWKTRKLEELDEVIRNVCGLYLEASASSPTGTPGGPLKLQLEVINRSTIPIKLTSVQYPYGKGDSIVNSVLENSVGKKYITALTIPANTPFSQPYWLTKKDSAGMFHISNLQDVGLPENRPAATVDVNLQVAGQSLKYTIPVVYKYNDPVDGEIYQPFVVAPPVFANIAEKVHMFPTLEPKPVTVFIKAGESNIQGKLELQVSQGWRVEPASVPFQLQAKDAEQTVRFMVYPPAQSSEAEIRVVMTVNGRSYNKGLNTISYSHFPLQTSFPEAKAKVVRLDLLKKGTRIGYLMGAGDDVPGTLQQIGYDVTLLKDADIYPENLARYDAVILGVRAYNTINRINIYHDKLMNYVKDGGNLIVQYNTNGDLPAVPGPYPFKVSRDRITVEGSEVRFLAPEHPVLNNPNKISSKDFEGWVQERGLYFPNEWSSEYKPIISINDPGEAPLDGGLLVAQYGKGNFIYTGLSWFRQLPAGVPGAYRIFTNLISLGK